jgi:hypothetical protein
LAWLEQQGLVLDQEVTKQAAAHPARKGQREQPKNVITAPKRRQDACYAKNKGCAEVKNDRYMKLLLYYRMIVLVYFILLPEYLLTE